ncbi:SDR family NAD(P)-dependent oxidoreductase [Chitinophaga agrisoli]|uniref:SDR family NAD(P)-dependent oxidoreductase n=1 Tax=Chitinophaga agrisoli TaxID=2607653 RepID=A0A5B2VHS0_9BACT|nr:SDR family NAD(P)-dependent oxidoreductase [Chitinophaga agrisoli]KAA2238474.1 SDR family NAD(P)-dependent oxidoreductase [Chitinophaga agrisoli]
MDLGLQGKTIFITGGSKGIGRATALAYGKEPGAQVAISYCHSREAANEIVQLIEAGGGKAMAVEMDLAAPGSLELAVSQISRQWGGIDVLVNNAVVWGDPSNRGKNLEEQPWEAWQEMININLLGTVKLTRLVVPFMRSRGWGRIVNISSDLSTDSMKGSGPYSTLKAAYVGFIANLVEEYAAFNILSNNVLPSWTLTERAKKFFPAQTHETLSKAYPTGRITLPEDVASLILYLGSAANGHVNGESIRVTGKASMPLLNYLFKEVRATNA